MHASNFAISDNNDFENLIYLNNAICTRRNMIKKVTALPNGNYAI